MADDGRDRLRPCWVDALAVAFVSFRAVYAAFYVGDMPTLRSLSWFAGVACVLGLFVLAM